MGLCSHKHFRMKTFIVDAFTNKAFSGNPAAVCLPSVELGEDVMQKIASEMRHSETCFAVKCAENDYMIRWFTPTNEVDLCGHGTLATAHVLFYVETVTSLTEIKFITKKGLQLVVHSDSIANTLAMMFPCYPPELISHPVAKTSLQQLIGPVLKPDISYDTQIVAVYWSKETKKLFFVLSDDIDISTLYIEQKEFDLWMGMCDILPFEVRGICITNKDKSSDIGIKMRYFSPWNGIGEDPVNGSSHTVLGPLWKSRCSGQSVFHSRICSKRGGSMFVKVTADDSLVELKGSAVVILSGEIKL